ncbi:MAG: cytochrome c oxidase subunit II [Pseudomonadota bacterium]|jgi:cytochrome c oxidase subunit 2
MQTLTLASGGVLAGGAPATPLALPAPYWDQMFSIWLIVAVGIYLIVALPMFYFLFRYRYRKGVNETGAIEEGGPGIEVLWTVIPLIIVIYLAMQSLTLYTRQRTPPPDSLPVKVEGMMWGWNFEYPNGKKSTTDLYVPVGKPVKLLLTSRDVIHAFHIPDAKTMEDAVPGRVTHMWFQFNKTGDYRAFCREYCGTAHAYMLATIKVVTPEEFEQWLKQPG